MLPDETLFLTVRELGEQLRARKLTSVMLTESYLARLQAHGATLGAVATLTPELALQQARAADAELSLGRSRGPLHGIPFGLKDLFATRGIATTWGAPPFRDQVLDVDAAVVTLLREAGAVLVAKLSMIELAGAGGYSSPSASLQGATRCPHNLAHWAGGSSSGPGAAVAAALVGFAIGTETLGSIISPSAFSGVAGLRPTYGRVSRFGAMACSWTMDKVGPLARSAVDCGLVLNAIAGPDARDASALATKLRWRAKQGKSKPLAGKRLAVVSPDFASEGDPEVGRAFAAALDVLRELGATVAAAELPDLPYRSVALTIYSAEAATIFRPLFDSGELAELIDPAQKAGLTAARSLLAADYLDASRLRAEMQLALGRTFEGFDAIVAPSRLDAAPLLDANLMAKRAGTLAKANDRVDVIAAGNVAGLPAISVPCGFVGENLPAGLQFVADATRDDVCLDLAAAYQEVTPWHRRRPTGLSP